MSTHLFGLTKWTFAYDHSVGRNEFAGTGFRNPVDMAIGDDDTVYVLNRSYENRPDGVHVTVVKSTSPSLVPMAKAMGSSFGPLPSCWTKMRISISPTSG